MDIGYIDILKDDRTNCLSVMTTMLVGDYMKLIEISYRQKGGIEEQREPLKTSSAIRIRKRMVEDIANGAVLPPIVLGMIVSQDEFSKASMNLSTIDLSRMLIEFDRANLLLIDGMQRTSALFESNLALIIKRRLRVEIWMSVSSNSLIYRMLVLNAAQVPWNLRRQIEVVFRTMVRELREAVPGLILFGIEDGNRRSQGGQYQASDIIELYLAFGARKEKIDTKDRLADEFSRLDFIEASEYSQFTQIFYQCIHFMTLIDKSFSRYIALHQAGSRFQDGKDLFGSQPLRVGFVTALSKEIFGRPGIDRTDLERKERWNLLHDNLESFAHRTGDLELSKLESFLSLDILSESIQKRSGKIGDFEREYFTKAFDSLIEEKFLVLSMEICWRAY